MVMRASKAFIVIAYDISETKRRNKVAKLLRQYGSPINLSVFECMVTEAQLINFRESIYKLIDSKQDKVVYYRMCLNCYTKITYQPEHMKKSQRYPELSELICENLQFP